MTKNKTIAKVVASLLASGAIACLVSTSTRPPYYVDRVEEGDVLGGRSAGPTGRLLPGAPPGTQIPEHAEVFADVSEPFDRERHVPFFWHILKSGGTAVHGYLFECDRLAVASEVGVAILKSRDGGNGFAQDEENKSLKIVETKRGNRFVNVDTTTPEGLIEAKELGLAESGMADVVVSSYFFEGSLLFDESVHRGRMFAVFRHPVQRAASMFYYRQVASWEPTYNPDLANISIEEYARSPKVEENWMTRFLLNKRRGVLTQQDLQAAKEILGRKCLVGLQTNMGESLRRFELYFGWEALKSNATECRSGLTTAPKNGNKHRPLDSESEAWRLLLAVNWFDVQLYHYAQELFETQGRELFSEEMDE